jgi:hypothetical protein
LLDLSFRQPSKPDIVNSVTVTVTPPPPGGTLTRQIAASTDDVNESGWNVDDGFLVGQWGFDDDQLRRPSFRQSARSCRATITSAHLRVYSSQNQWIDYSFTIAVEATGNSATFTTSSPPSQRAQTVAKVSHSDNVKWTSNTWYSLDEMKAVIQEVIGRTDWQAGNSLSIVIKGTGTGTFARKFVANFDGDSANAPMLIVSYTTNPSQSPTATISVSPTNMASGQSATLSWNTTNAASVSIDQGIGAVPVSGSVTVSPTITTTCTITATGPSSVATQSTTLSVGSSSAMETYFAVGLGFSDVVPHQLIRTATDRLYVFAGQPYSTTLNAQWTPNVGLPNSSGDFGGSPQSTRAAIPISVSPADDGPPPYTW